MRTFETGKALTRAMSSLAMVLAAIACCLGIAFPQAAQAATLDVVYDSFTTVENTDVNFLPGIALGKADEITCSNDNFVIAYNSYQPNLSYSTAVALWVKVNITDWGTYNTTFGEPVTYKLKPVDGSVKLMFYNKALLADGSLADVEITVDDIEFSIGARNPNCTSTSNVGWTTILVGNGKFLNPQAKHFSTEILYEPSTTAKRLTQNPPGVSMRFTVRVLDHETHQPVNANGVLIVADDVDIAGTMELSGYCTAAQTYADPALRKKKFDSRFSESIEFMTGFGGSNKLHLASHELSAEDAAAGIVFNQGMETTETGYHGGTRVHGEAYQAHARGSNQDNGDLSTYWSGFMTVADPKGFSFYWTGQSCGSELLGSNGVDVIASRLGEGTIDREGTSSYAIGSTVPYDYTPATGHKATSLKVNGNPVSFDPAGGTYTFENLFSDPLLYTDTPGKDVASTDLYSRAAPATIDVVFEPISYQIAFDKNLDIATGTMANQSMVYDTPANLNANQFSSEHHTFLGWNTKADGSGTAYTDGQEVNNLVAEDGGVVTLYAQWDPEDLTVIFKDGLTGDTLKTQTVEYGGDATPPTKPTHEGYTADDWDKPYTNITENTTITVNYTPNAYEIAFDKNATDATGSMTNQQMIYDTPANLKANEFTWTGHTWNGWNTKSDGSGTPYANQQEVNNLTAAAGGIVTLYAQWDTNKITVIFKDGLTGETLDTQSIDYGSNATPPTKPDHTGYTTGDWDKPYTNITEDNTVITVNYTPINYEIAFDKNADGATGSMTNQQMVYDTPANLKANEFGWTGHTWNGWNTKADGTGTPYANQQEVNNLTSTNGDIVTLYAQWDTNKITVIFKDGLTGETIDTQSIDYGSDATPPAKPEHTGYKADDWDKPYTNITEDNTVITVNYTPINYEIAFDKNGDGATGNMTNQQMVYDTPANLKANEFTWTGHTWNGWNTQADGTGTPYTNQQEVNNLTATDGDIVTLYAQWDINKVHVTYVDGFVNQTIDEQTIDYGSDAIPPEKPTHTGYKPGEWDKPSTNVTEDRIITVNYSPINYIIRYDKNATDATGNMSDQQMIYDTPANLTANAFSRTGWTWKGWNDKADGAGTSYTNQQEVNNLIAEDGGVVTLYAQWDQIMLEVIYIDGHTNQTIDTQTVPYGGDATPPAKPEHTGYKPGDWNKPSTNITENTTILVPYSPISYVIKYDKNESTATGTMNDQQMYYDQPDNLYANVFTSPAKTWVNWNTKADGSGTTYADRADIINLVAEDGGVVTMYAQWTDKMFTVTYIDGHTGQIIGTQQVPYGGDATPPAKPGHNGYKPGDWDKPSTNITKDTTITVPYSPIGYVVVFDKNADDATGNMDDQNMLFDQAANLTPNAFERPGYAFAGWKDDAGNRYSNTQEVINLADTDGARVPMHAQWTEAGTSYTVNHVIKGQDDPFETEVLEGVTGTDTQAAPITKTGYVPEPFEQQKIKGDGSTVVTITYRPAAYRILFDPNAEDATGEMEPQEMEYDKADTLTPNAFEREGYVWVGWKDETGNEYADEQEVLNLVAEDGGEIVLYAQWQKLLFAKWIDPARPDDPIIKEDWALDPETIEAPADPEREGYTFDGWDKEVDEEGNITYTAKWAEIQVKDEPVEPAPAAPQITPAQPQAAAVAQEKITSTGDAHVALILIPIAAIGLAVAIGVAHRR